MVLSGHNHRTLLLVDATEEARNTANFIGDRVRRLFESVGGENIKVDIVALTGQDVTTKVKSLEALEALPASSVPVLNIHAISQEAAVAGYTQVLLSFPAGRAIT